ncbi:MAG TPA: alpha/beta hydrolase [Tepidisphaeraceae bacterium]|jgi:acetyl esterase/lipase|nr:alpha/beta hydrolase [Tepidisphaeraceae bacterium]
MKKSMMAGALVLMLSVPAWCAEPATMNVWPAAPLGETRKFEPEKIETNKANVQILHNVFKPTLTIYHPPKDKDTGASVIICPGGGYSILAWDLEGTEVAAWLNDIGVTGIVLRYRCPTHKTADVHGFMPLMDAQRAISLVRSKSKELGIDPRRIGILGFSAGGNLAALACTNFDRRSYDAIDEVDQVSCRPDFGVLCYPAYLVAAKTEELNPDIRVTPQTPPIFFVHADNDGVSSANSAVMYLALKRAGVSSELHIYTVGGHGFGLRPTTRPVCKWPERCEEWMTSQGILKPQNRAPSAPSK